MMGDSRYNSKDSRYWGFVPRENVRGKPLFVYYSYNADDSDGPLPMLTDIRWSRIGTGSGSYPFGVQRRIGEYLFSL